MTADCNKKRLACNSQANRPNGKAIGYIFFSTTLPSTFSDEEHT